MIDDGHAPQDYWDVRSHKRFWRDQKRRGLSDPSGVRGFFRWAGASFMEWSLGGVNTAQVAGEVWGDTESSGTDKALVGGELALTVVLMAAPGGKAAPKPIAGKIVGYTRYGLNRVISRDAGAGVARWAILDAVRNPLKIIYQKNGRVLYRGKNAYVVLENGRIHNAWARSNAARRSPKPR